MTAPAPPGIVSLRSVHGFADTLRRLREAFAQRGLKVFAEIDQQAEASAVGLRMPPATLLLFGQPKAGTPLMIERPLSALDLPLKVLVGEALPGEVLVSFNTAHYIVQRHALPERLGAGLAPAEALIAAVVTGSEAATGPR